MSFVEAKRAVDALDPQSRKVVYLLMAMLDAELLPPEPCGYPGCGDQGCQYRNGVWCPGHVRKMEWRPWS